jgi:hypothetical protein
MRIIQLPRKFALEGQIRDFSQQDETHAVAQWRRRVPPRGWFVQRSRLAFEGVLRKDRVRAPGITDWRATQTVIVGVVLHTKAGNRDEDVRLFRNIRSKKRQAEPHSVRLLDIIGSGYTPILRNEKQRSSAGTEGHLKFFSACDVAEDDRVGF